MHTDDTTEEEISLFSPRSKSKFHSSNKSRINTEENNKIDIKYHNGHKTKERKEKKELNCKKENNASNSTKEAIMNNNKDIDLSPKESKKANKREQVDDKSEEVVTVIDDSECEVIDENILKRKPNEKLAPLFIKRRKMNSIVVAARRSFLQSDIIDMDKSTDCKTNNNVPMLLFPAISHVTQLEDSSALTEVENKHKYQMKTESRYLPSIDINNYKCITNYKEVSKTSEMVNEPVKENIDTVLSEIEKFCPDVRELWKALTIKNNQKRDMESLDDQKPLKEKKSPSRMRGRKTKQLERKKKAESSENKEDLFHDCAWTCKYKPKSAQGIVGNEEAANKLKSWLSGWRASLTNENDGSSGDEFYSSDCSSMCNNENNQIAVLLGPHGSGKSASVYAIAEELGYRFVMEKSLYLNVITNNH